MRYALWHHCWQKNRCSTNRSCSPSISQCMGAWLGRSRTLSWTELEFTLPQRLVYIDALWTCRPSTAGSSFFNYVDGPLVLVSAYFFKGGFGLFASKMFWFLVRLSEDNPPSLIFKVFVVPLQQKSFSVPMILRRGNSPFLQPMPEKLFPNVFVIAGMRLWVWLEVVNEPIEGNLWVGVLPSMRLGCSSWVEELAHLGMHYCGGGRGNANGWCNSSSSSSSIRLAFFQLSYTIL